MENRIMRKHLIGTILVLAALAACNKEIDTQTPAIVDPVEETPAGKVTLTFKATIGEETRTVYANDKTASWAAGDKISVCLTDSESYDVVDFTTEDGVTFTGEVNPGYTTPVSAIYPANEVYTTYSWNSYFSQDDGSVTAVRLADGYELGSDDDPGKFIPLIGTYDGETMTFHHFCNTLKVTLTNIPEDAAYFTFATNKQKLVSDFSLTGGRMGLVSQEDDVDTSVYFEFEPGSLTTRSFYIPVPDGTLAANSYVALQDGGGADLFKKRISSSPTFGLNANEKDAIRVLPEVACWTRNEDWNAYYFGPYKSDGTIKQRISLENMTGSYYYEVLTNSQFNNTYHGSAADYFSSTHFSTKISGLTTSYTASVLNLNYSSLTKGKYYVMLFGLDSSRKFTGEYSCIEVVNPTFSTPEGWSISVVDDYKVAYTVPDGTKWQYVSVTASDFETTYLGHLEYLIYKGIRDRKGWHEQTPSSWGPRTGNLTTVSSTANEGDYIYLCIGIDENYRPTGEYCRLDYSFETPSEAYSAWLGTWTVTDSKSTPNVDTWTISRKQANHTYSVSGMNGNLFTAVANYDAINNRIVFQSQIVGSSNTSNYYLFGSGSDVNHAVRQTEEPYDLMYVEQTANGITLNGFTLPDNTVCARYYRMNYNRSTSAWTYNNARYIPSILTPAE